MNKVEWTMHGKDNRSMGSAMGYFGLRVANEAFRKFISEVKGTQEGKIFLETSFTGIPGIAALPRPNRFFDLYDKHTRHLPLYEKLGEFEKLRKLEYGEPDLIAVWCDKFESYPPKHLDPLCLGCIHAIREVYPKEEYGNCGYSKSINLALCEVKTTAKTSKRVQVQEYYKFYKKSGIEVYVAQITALNLNGEYLIEISELTSFI